MRKRRTTDEGVESDKGGELQQKSPEGRLGDGRKVVDVRAERITNRSRRNEYERSDRKSTPVQRRSPDEGGLDQAEKEREPRKRGEEEENEEVEAAVEEQT